MEWNDRVAIVTGAASGIGAATALEFASRGARTCILDINSDGAEEVASRLRSSGLKADAYEVDVSDSEACSSAVGIIADRYGQVDYLVNNAVSFISKGIDVTADEWNHLLGVNVRGNTNMVQACFPSMRQRGGAIVNVTSISAHIAQPNRWTYNACKGAILTMTKCQALDLSAYGIRVNAVSPGWIWTPEVAKAADGDRERWEPVWGKFHMLRRLGEPGEVAKCIVFLCSDDASFVTGAELMVDGGYLSMGPEGLGELSSFAGSA